METLAPKSPSAFGADLTVEIIISKESEIELG
jgi:hypothetical protein